MSRPLRVTYVINSLEQGGAERQLAELIGGLDRERFEPSLVVCSDKDDLGYDLGVPRRSLHARVFPTPGSMRRLVAALRELQPDVVHTFKGLENVAGRLAARAAGVRAVIGAVRCPKLPPSERLGERLTHRMADAIVVNSVGIRDVLVTDIGVPAAKIHVVENGIDLARFIPLSADERARERTERGFGDDFVLVVPGRISPEKNQLAIVGALAEMRRRGTLTAPGGGRLRVLFAGRDSLLTYGPLVRATIVRHGLQAHVRLLGIVDRIDRLIGAADGVLLPSSYEGLSNAVIEAMACAVPVVISPAANMDALVTDGVEGIVTRGTTRGAIADGIARLVALDAGTRRAMGHVGAEHATRRFTIARMVAGTVAVYDRALPARERA